MSRSRNSARSHGNRHRSVCRGCSWSCTICHPALMLPKHRDARNAPEHERGYGVLAALAEAAHAEIGSKP